MHGSSRGARLGNWKVDGVDMKDHCDGRHADCYRNEDCSCHCHDNFREVAERKEWDWEKILKEVKR